MRSKLLCYVCRVVFPLARACRPDIENHRVVSALPGLKAWHVQLLSMNVEFIIEALSCQIPWYKRPRLVRTALSFQGPHRRDPPKRALQTRTFFYDSFPC